MAAIKASWARSEPPPAVLSPEDLRADARVRSALAAPEVLLSVCHDPFRRVAGGLQLCVRLEERRMLDRGQGHLAVHPWQPLPTLADPAGGDLVVLHAQGEEIGPVRLEDLGPVIAGMPASGRQIVVAVHSLLGHSPERLSRFMAEVRPERVLFWLHDHFTLCEGYNLQRNTVTYCGAPAPESMACGICIHGENRSVHLERLSDFFAATRPTVVAPSPFQLAFWQSRSALPHEGACVLPLAGLAPMRDVPAPPPDDGAPLRVAYIGWPADHKGWDAFCNLAEAGRSGEVEFHYFGTTGIEQKGIETHSLDVTPERPDAATMALWTAGIDIVVHWATWPETFSFTAHEALAADALVVTSPLSGNVAVLATQDARVHVLPDRKALIHEVLSGELAALARARRAGRSPARVIYSAASAELLPARGQRT
jgi:hypothetical protein